MRRIPAHYLGERGKREGREAGEKDKEEEEEEKMEVASWRDSCDVVFGVIIASFHKQ